MENNNEIKSKKVEFSIGKNFLEDLINKIDDKDLIAVNDLLSKLHASDVAEVVTNLPEKQRFELIALENFNINPNVIVELTDELQKEILEKISADKIVKIINSLESDNALQIVENLSETKKNEWRYFSNPFLDPKTPYSLSNKLQLTFDLLQSMNTRDTTNLANIFRSWDTTAIDNGRIAHGNEFVCGFCDTLYAITPGLAFNHNRLNQYRKVRL